MTKCTSWLGHKLEARHDHLGALIKEYSGPVSGVAAISEAVSGKRYVGDICVRCGWRVPRDPTSGVTEA